MASSQKVLQPCSTPVSNERWKRIQWLQRAQWLRVAILGANDGLLSTTSLMLGIGAAKEDRQSMILSGLAGALAGACSMAVGEFVSVSSQRDIEVAITACRNLETKPVETNWRLSDVLTPGRSPVMKVVAEDSKMKLKEDGETEEALPNPYKAAAASALAFLFGSFLPLASAAFITRNTIRIAVIAVVSSIELSLFGGFGAYVAASPSRRLAVRVLIGGWIAMGITYGLLKPFDRSMGGLSRSIMNFVMLLC